jgi:hypothetical protein
VQALITFFFELCLLRRAPQDLPASETLFRLVLIADIVAGVLVGVTSGVHPLIGLAQSMLEISLMLALLFGGLRLAGHPGRFNQSATALLGTGTLIGILALPVVALSSVGGGESDAATLGSLLLVGLLCWSILVTAHIVRHAFALSLGQGIGIAVAYQFLAIVILNLLFGGL